MNTPTKNNRNRWADRILAEQFVAELILKGFTVPTMKGGR